MSSASEDEESSVVCDSHGLEIIKRYSPGDLVECFRHFSGRGTTIVRVVSVHPKHMVIEELEDKYLFMKNDQRWYSLVTPLQATSVFRARFSGEHGWSYFERPGAPRTRMLLRDHVFSEAYKWGIDMF